jgi:hypothetical protein
MTWTEAAEAQARAEGWQLVDVIDNGQTHVYQLIMGAGSLGSRFKNTQQATAFVVDRARSGSSLHHQALKLTMMSRLRPTRKRKP